MDQLRSAVLAEGQADPAAEFIASVVSRVRTEVASHRANRLNGDAATVPESLLDVTMRLIIWAMQSRINVFNAVAPSEQDVIDHRDDLAYLRRVASGEIVVEDALVEGAVPGSPSIQLVNAPPRPATRESLRGL